MEEKEKEKEREGITGKRGNIGKREERFIIYYCYNCMFAVSRTAEGIIWASTTGITLLFITINTYMYMCFCGVVCTCTM